MPEAGWYPDPADPGRRRWWDGNAWTEHRYPGATPPRSGRGRERSLESPPRLLASPGRRLGARVLDALILGAAELPLMLIYLVPRIHVTEQHGQVTGVSGASLPFAFVLLLALVNCAYEVGMVATKGATLGKMIVGIRVEQEDGSPVHWGAAAMRWFLESGIFVVPLVGSLVGLGVFLVSAVFIFTDARRQTVWDKAARTIVVRDLARVV